MVMAAMVMLVRPLEMSRKCVLLADGVEGLAVGNGEDVQVSANAGGGDTGQAAELTATANTSPKGLPVPSCLRTVWKRRALLLIATTWVSPFMPVAAETRIPLRDDALS